MKLVLLLASLLLFITTTQSKNYYVSATGNDNDDGLTSATSWQTIAKVNASFNLFSPGDAILFKSGDSFYGPLIIGKSGSVGNPIVIGSYGTGAKPIITGFTTISGWTNEGGGIYSKVISSAAQTNMVVIDGVQYAMGRFPDAAYLSYETFVTGVSITDNTLGNSIDWTGAEAVIRKNDWTLERCIITNHNQNTLTYTSTGTNQYGTANFGYFIQNDLRTVTSYGEWYHDYAGTGKFYMYFGAVDPATKVVQVATQNNALSNAGNDYVTISNINFSGSIDNAINFTSSTDYCNIQDCDVSLAGKNGILLTAGTNTTLNNNNINKCNNNGISTDAMYTTITNNSMTNIGTMVGQVLGSSGYNGIYTPGNNVVIMYNTLRNIGATGIVLKYTGPGTIQYNLLDSIAVTLDDGGGIYASAPNTSLRTIDHNIVLNVIGNSNGTNNTTSLSAGIYLDELAANINVTNNTVANIPYAGIKLHKTYNNVVTKNIAFNNGLGIYIQDASGTPLINNILQGNVFFEKTAAQYALQFFNNIANTTILTADSNYYARPINDNLVFTIQDPSTNYAWVNRNLAGWQTFSGQDAHSKKSPRAISDANDLRFEYNASKVTKTVTLGARYIGPDSLIYNGFVTLQPYTSAVLIKVGPVQVNQAPRANAGSDKIISLPINATTLTGIGTDTDGNIAGYSWVRISGPAAGVIVSPNTATTDLNNLPAGIYQYQLTVTDNEGATAQDIVQVIVNQPPTADAGSDKLVNLPVNTTVLNGNGIDTDGSIATYAWIKISGPASSGVIATPNAAITNINNLVAGVYQYQLTVIDNYGASGTATVLITVNKSPVANAGPDKLITVPANSVTLTGSGTDADGYIASYAWLKIAGPSSGSIENADAATTDIDNLSAGTYQYQLTVTDDKGATGTSTVTVTVNQLPVANAGPDKLISLPVNTTTLTGNGTDADGTISSYAWIKLAGPASGTIASPDAATTDINNLSAGIYQYQLTVTDNNGAIGTSAVTVIVNQPPAADAGVDKMISLPANSITLSGTGTDIDGNVTTYTWAKISGPAAGSIETPNTATTNLNGLAAGVYQYKLTVTDDRGATGTSTVTITVNRPPSANAGSDKMINLPANSVTLSGSGTDTDGSIAGYAWEKIAGPSSGTIATPNAATTDVNNLTPGIYQYQLTVTDNNGATGTSTVNIIVNQPPAANAGADKIISLPTNTITLTGTATDPDGSISSYTWAKISGPSAGTIATPNAGTTVVSNLAQGTYQYKLTVTDDNGATATSTVTVIVNQPPSANAGSNKLINLPVNSVTLTGSGLDTDGTVSNYEWVKTDGPASGTIATPNTATTSLTGLVQGTYVFQLTVTDNNGATGTATVQVTVNAPPVANAGADKLISLPTNTVSLSGTGTDVDGTISSYAWTKVSGPASGTIATPNASTTALNGLAQGIYVYQLTVTDNNGATGIATVQVTVNAAPVANAGTNILISLPTNTTTLTGAGADADGTITSYAWAKSSGPASGIITAPNAATTSLTGLVQGIYVFQLTVTDNNGASGTATVQVTVNAAPVANAGADKLISLPTNTVSLSGTGTDVDGTISSYVWAKLSGPASGTIATPNAATTALNGLAQGIYVYQLTVTDNNGATGTATVQVTVNAAPVANAGNNVLISLPTNTTSLTGTGTDADGTISGYAWAKLSGPASGTIATPNAATTTLNGLAQGIYIYQLTVTDNNGATGTATVQVTVNAAPVANAGADKLISLPVNTVSLTGTGTDADGTIGSYTWAKLSGPASGTIATPNAATTALNGLAQGIYVYQLTVTDNNGATGTATVQVTVNAAPVANAGTNILISMPVSTTTLTGSGTDADGTISSYAWVKISGPAAGTIATPNAATTLLNSLAQGVYLYQLTVTDNNGATGTATVQVTVNGAPAANAGTNILISLPANTTTLTGTGTDVDGTISSYAWSKLSGPASGTIATPNAATTALNGLAQGIYVYQLTVTDNNGATGTATVQVTVNAAPVASAGTNKLISLPTNTTSLTGTGTDADGTISSYAWAKLSGPASGTIATPTAATTALNGLVQGIYVYQLTVTDNNGATGTATVQVTVNAAPVANAGNNILISLPANTTTLTGTGTDGDGTVSSYAWAKLSGPASGTIATPNAATTSLTGLAQGIYVYQLTVTDNNGATGTATVQVTVNAAPVANAGTDKMISLPVNTTSLAGTGTDVDGTISSYTWAKLSGPASGTIATPNAATTSLTGLVQGVYVYQLTVTDNNGATGTATMQVTVNAAPVANAGTNILISMPVSTTTLTGTGTDADGTINSYAWAKLSGPATGTIATPNAATTALNSLAQGVYVYQLTVTDNNGATGTATVQVTVNAAPVANPGTNKLISLPTNTTSLTGSGTDADGTISSYAWAKLSGPATGTIATPNAATTSLTGLVQGTYVFQLTVTDNNGATGTATVQVTVNAAPVANAGNNTIISLPVSTTSLTGSGTDADGTISSYAWAKLSGPASGTIATPNAATTSLTGLAQGVYVFQLTVTDNNGATGTATVQVTVNGAPVANAGADKLISLPTNTTILTGTGTDADGTISSYAWVKISGPASGTIATPAAATTTISSLVQGSYQFQLTVTDNNGATGKDTILVTVNQLPVANAGIDKIISLPVNTTSLTGTGTDADGTVSSYAWVKISGPATGTIATPTTATTVLSSLVQGVYQYQLTVTDNNGSTGKDTVQVTVNQPPLANAGIDKVISLPTNTTTLTGSGTDADGTVSSYTWVKISGPVSGTIATPNAATTTISSLAQGIYQYQLTVTDNNGATGKDTIQVTVNQLPVANAGIDKVINLPTNTATLTGTGTDADGTISSYAWVKISGPATGTIATPNAATTILNSLVQGVYLYQLTVTDNNGATGKDTIQVRMNASPVANAGADKLLISPTSTTTLTGAGTDADGTISSYAWVKISGPAAGTIASPNAATTVLNSLVQGVYLYQLTVTDNNGATGKDTVQVRVNQSPVANAGADKIITLPVVTTTLTGTGTDADGTISSYAWVKISGPATGTIATPTAATTVLNNLAQGVYLYQLTVTDNNGATGKDTVQVRVNKAPVANAGTDKVIILPTNSSSLTGTGTDADGTISSYAWAKISGPASGTIATPAAATTNITGLVQGTYQYQLTVTDNNGATGKDTVQVRVNQAPVANAGVDKVLISPTNTTTLTGTGTDADGTISSYAWVKLSGPATGTIASPAAATTALNSLVQGTYQYQLTVTDNNGSTGKDTVLVRVNQLPVANAGIDKVITLPVNTSTLTGTGTDADGTVTSYAWVKISGPATGTIVSPAAATTVLNNLVQGVYLYQLTVTDNNGSIGKDTIQVRVNKAPVANAGTDKVITLPTKTTTLTGSGTDADGTISSYAWAKISGPATGTIASPAAATTVLNNLVQGTYLFQLTVTDNNGAAGKDTVQVKVNAATGQLITKLLPHKRLMFTSGNIFYGQKGKR